MATTNPGDVGLPVYRTLEPILRCPITHGALSFLSDAGLEDVRRRVVAGELAFLNGAKGTTDFNMILKTDAAEIYYVVRGDILVLLSAFALVDDQQHARYSYKLTNNKTLAVMDFYDRSGWTEASDGVFVDADINEDFREVSREYISRCHAKVKKLLPSSGEYIVDVASGPVQYDDYLQYSSGFKARICCDVSHEALARARAKLGSHGVYIQCDASDLPLKDEAVDACVSLHTIYHLPPDLQATAFNELERITRPGGKGVIVYSWADRSAAMNLVAAPGRMLDGAVALARSALRMVVPKAVRRWLRRSWNGGVAAPAEPVFYQEAASSFCFHAHTLEWCRRQFLSRANWGLTCWRSVSVEFLKSYVPDNASGRFFLSRLYWLETSIPEFMGRVGQYPMFFFSKSATHPAKQSAR